MPVIKSLRYIATALALSLLPLKVVAGPWQGSADGYPLSNFAVTANVTAQGDLFGDVLFNKGKLGPWLDHLGAFPLSVVKDGVSFALSSFERREVQRSCPFVRASFKGHAEIGSELSYTAWAPVGVDDIFTSALPALMLELKLYNPSPQAEALELRWETSSLPDRAAVYIDSQASEAVTLELGPGESRELRIALVLWDEMGYTAPILGSPEGTALYVTDNWSSLKGSTAAFDAEIPVTGDAELDEYLRWYLVPSLALTRCNAKGKVLTLGYCELNQRDSYWASWMHLALMPSAERIMIEESVQGMRPSGKVPTCLLPRIDRKDDIDINAFFILRCYRYAAYYHDTELIGRHWEDIKKAAAWLMELDDEGTGLPRQRSTWADWKDVSGVKGRRYSPFSCLVYMAAMERMSRMAKMLGDKDACAAYKDAYKRARRQINKPIGKGGLWGGRYYCQRWDDGRDDTRLLEDQMIGVFFDVVPHRRVRRIIKALNSNNLTPYGIAETYPYYDESFGYSPGTYHNGAVWPWLSFMDDWARIRMGRRREALELVKTVARADLVESGDWSANEHINSLTGENLGFQLQGWSADLFGLVRFGLCEPDFNP